MTVAPGALATEDTDFERFYARWHPTVCRWAMARYGASHAEEIAQETLSRAFVNFRELRHELPWPWLLTVARNVACDLHRLTLRCAAASEQGLVEHPDPYPGPEEIAVRSDVSQRVRAAMRLMPIIDRQLLDMSIDDMSIAEMADVLGTSEGAVRVRLHRARKRLSHLYVRKGGNLALTPIGVLALALRKLRRGIQQAVPTVAPTTAMLAATATVATIGAVVAGAPAVTFDRGHARPAAVSSPDNHQRAHLTPAGARNAAHRVTPAQVPPGQSSSGGSGIGASTGNTAPVGAAASAKLGKDPSKHGTFHQDDIGVTTPVGKAHIDGEGVRGTGSGLACARLGLSC